MHSTSFRSSFRPSSRLSGQWLFLPLLLVIGCGSVTRPAGEQDAAVETDAGVNSDGRTCAAPAPGKFIHQLSVDGVTREVIVYVPQGAVSAAPAVFMFHGSTGTGEKFYRISRWREKADETGLIAVFPTALVHCYYDTKDEAYKTTTKWSGGKFGTEHLLCTPAELDNLSGGLRAAADHPEADDIGFVNATIDLLTDDYCVDDKRVYSAGFSNGSGFSARVGLELSERIAAFAMASGAPVVDTIATRPISAMMHVGAVESGLPVSEAAWANAGYQELLVRAVDGLQLTTAYTFDQPVFSGVSTAQFSFSTSSAGNTNTFQALVIDGLSHQYPNGTNHPIRMADVHWDFFSLHTLDENP